MNNTPPPKNNRFAAYHQRRLSLIARMQQAGGGVAVIPTAPEQVRNRDAHFPFRADSYFQYLTGFNEPDAVLVIVVCVHNATARSLLFCR